MNMVAMNKLKNNLSLMILKHNTARYNSELKRIITAQNKLSGTNNSGFIYKGKHYGISSTQNSQLHPSLEEDFKKVVDASEITNDNFAYIISYISKAFNVLTPIDIGMLFHVLPHPLHKALEEAQIEKASNPPPQEVIQEIERFNERGKQLLNIQMLINLSERSV